MLRDFFDKAHILSHVIVTHLFHNFPPVSLSHSAYCASRSLLEKALERDQFTRRRICISPSCTASELFTLFSIITECLNLKEASRLR